MDGLAQSEYEHRTASGLQCPRVNLTYRWIGQHITSCPRAGVVGCVLPLGVHNFAENSFHLVGQSPTLVTLVCKRECANGGEPKPVRWSRIMHPLALR